MINRGSLTVSIIAGDECSMRDTINLRHNAAYETQIYKNVYWVPVNVLGKTRYTNDEMAHEIRKYTVEQIRDLKFSVYEAIQYFQLVMRFQETNDIVFYKHMGHNWQLHKSGRYAYETNCGCCASSAAWLNYVIEKTYPDRGYFHFIRQNGSGHVLNYIKDNGNFYIIDMSTQTYENAKYVPVENGNMKQYIASQLYSGICYKTTSLLDFVKYHRKVYVHKGLNVSYLLKPPTSALPPSCIEWNNGELTLYEPTLSYLLSIRNFRYVVVDEFDFGVNNNVYSNGYI